MCLQQLGGLIVRLTAMTERGAKLDWSLLSHFHESQVRDS